MYIRNERLVKPEQTLFFFNKRKLPGNRSGWETGNLSEKTLIKLHQVLTSQEDVGYFLYWERATDKRIVNQSNQKSSTKKWIFTKASVAMRAWVSASARCATCQSLSPITSPLLLQQSICRSDLFHKQKEATTLNTLTEKSAAAAAAAVSSCHVPKRTNGPVNHAADHVNGLQEDYRITQW